MAALTETKFQTDERWVLSNASETSDAFLLDGGLYAVEVSATFNAGSVTLQRLAADASTYVTCLTAFSTSGYATVSLPPGSYKVAISLATAVYVEIAAVARAAVMFMALPFILIFGGGL